MSAIRPQITHVILIDGTFASLAEGQRSSVGRIHRLLTGDYGPLNGDRVRVFYAQGQQWNRWRTLPEVAMGHGLTLRIIEAYGWLASRYRPGDRVFMFGYSRGAFAVRSLAGMMARVGLLRPEAATERNIRLAWRYYCEGGSEAALATFRRRRGQDDVPIQMLGCFDTVMALGLRLPLLWMLTEPRFRFHDTHLAGNVLNGFHALALDETRAVFAPVLWDDQSEAQKIVQMWFRGAHPDVGGQLSGYEYARPLANIPLVWMLEQAQALGLPLPQDWASHFECDPTAPSIGSWRRWGKAFLARAPRIVGRYANEQLHETVPRPYSGPAILTGHLADQASYPLHRRVRMRRSLTAGPVAMPDTDEPQVGDGSAAPS